jgi:hypothetical protein
MGGYEKGRILIKKIQVFLAIHGGYVLENTVKTNAIYLAVIGLGYRFFVLDCLPLAQSLSRTLSRKQFEISH